MKKSKKSEEDINNSITSNIYETDSSMFTRDQWSTKVDFLLACIGFSVGFGNVWRFPYLCHKHGGGAFLIPYFICVAVAGIPLFFLEVSLGQLLREGAYGVWNICPIFKGIGIASLVVVFILDIYYNVILAWVLRYLFASFTPYLPWSDCSFPEATKKCGDSVTPSEEYWTESVLHLSNGINDIGIIRWDLVLCLLLAWIIVFACICKGIRSSGKVMYVTATAPYLLLITLMVRGLMLDGAIDGVRYYLTPSWEKIWNTEVWVDAGTQIFFSYSISLGTLSALGSYNVNNHNCLRDSIIFSLANSMTSLLSGFVIFPVLGFMAKDLGVAVSDVVKSGPGLTFIVYPRAILNLPYPNIWSGLFFFMMLLLGLDSQFVGVEGLITAIDDSKFFNMRGYRRTLVTGVVCLILFICGLPMMTEGGMYIFQLLDYYSGSRIIVLIALFEVLAISVYGIDRYFNNIREMIGMSKGCMSQTIIFYMKSSYVFLTPIFSGTLFVMCMVGYKNLTYAGRPYPLWSIIMGWSLASLSVIMIPIVMIIKILRSKGTFKERIKYLIQPVYKSTQNPAFLGQKYKSLTANVELNNIITGQK